MIRRRHIIYVPGYDPRGYVEYYRMFRADYRALRELYDVEGTIARRPEVEHAHTCAWSASTRGDGPQGHGARGDGAQGDSPGDGWQVDTTYEFLRWEDIVRRDFDRPAWRVVPTAFRMIGASILNGVFLRIARAHWRFGLFVAYPFVLFLLWCLLGVGAGAATAWALQAAGVSATAATAGAAILAILVTLGAVLRTESRTYMLYLLQDVVSTIQFANGQRPDWEGRLDAFARTVAGIVRTSSADEIIVVGHSSGSFLAVDVMARALEIDPKLGQHGPSVALLTIGGNLPIVAFQPRAAWFRERLARVAREPSILWADYQSRRDIMNFFAFDPVAALGWGKAGTPDWPNPQIRPVQFRNIVGRARFARLQWRFFDLHFQFLRANTHADPYDYLMIAAGPFSLAERLAHPQDVTDAVSGAPDEAAAAWHRLCAARAAAHAPPPPARAAARM